MKRYVVLDAARIIAWRRVNVWTLEFVVEGSMQERPMYNILCTVKFSAQTSVVNVVGDV